MSPFGGSNFRSISNGAIWVQRSRSLSSSTGLVDCSKVSCFGNSNFGRIGNRAIGVQRSGSSDQGPHVGKSKRVDEPGSCNDGRSCQNCSGGWSRANWEVGGSYSETVDRVGDVGGALDQSVAIDVRVSWK
ncbi:unnamed protein product, partial [Nesidiocoris tenuis]